MAKEITPTEQSTASSSTGAEKAAQSIFSKKLIIIGIPIFVVQLAILYFLIAKFVVPSTNVEHAPVKTSEEETQKTENATQNIFLIKDIIINPAGTNGTRFLLTTVGIEVSTPEAQQELEKKELQVRDLLNSILTSKGLNDLVDMEQRELLRTEISKKVGDLVKSGRMKNVYFSKFIIQ